jgi:hypothetical protein
MQILPAFNPVERHRFDLAFSRVISDEPLECRQAKGIRESETGIRLKVFSCETVAKVADNAPAIYRDGRRKIFVIMMVSIRPDMETSSNGDRGSRKQPTISTE